MPQKVFINSEMFEADRAFVSARDSGFLYGAGLFETMRSKNGVVFALDDHLNRLLSSAKTLGIPHKYDRGYIADAISQTLKVNELSDARIRLTLTGGPTGMPADKQKGTLVIAATPFEAYPSEYYEKGALAVLCRFRHNTSDPGCGHKTCNYLSRLLAMDGARQKGAVESLWFTVDNRLAEGCVSNVFVVKDSKVFTPPLNTPVLPGIARKHVLQVAAQNAVETVEKDLLINDLLGADEVFITNTIMQILPIAAVEAHVVGDGKVGAVTKQLTEVFTNHFNMICGGSK
jgi:branched-chain amino acid aminotransferase